MRPDDLAREYLGALREHLANGNERALHRAYELGRKTIAAGLGVMDLAHAHQQAMVELAKEQGAGAVCSSADLEQGGGFSP